MKCSLHVLGSVVSGYPSVQVDDQLDDVPICRILLEKTDFPQSSCVSSDGSIEAPLLFTSGHDFPEITYVLLPYKIILHLLIFM